MIGVAVGKQSSGSAGGCLVQGGVLMGSRWLAALLCQQIMELASDHLRWLPGSSEFPPAAEHCLKHITWVKLAVMLLNGK